MEVWGVVLVVCVCVSVSGVLFSVGVCVCDVLISSCKSTILRQPLGLTRLRQVLSGLTPGCAALYLFIFENKLNHRSTNTGLGSTTSAPRGGDIGDKEREVRAGRSQGSRPSGRARTKEEAR